MTPQQWLEQGYVASFDQQRILLREFFRIVVDIVYDPCGDLPEDHEPIYQLDEYFTHAEVDKLPVLLIVGMLRGTHRVSDILTRRTAFLAAAHRELDKRGENTKQLLAGLKPWEHEEN